MNLFEQLNKTTKEAQEAKLNKAKQQAKETLKTLEMMLPEVAKEGQTEYEYYFSEEEVSQEVQKEIKKLLEDQGLAVDLSYRNMLISWKDKDFRRPWPGEISRYYNLVNKVNRLDSKVSFSSTSFEEVKEQMSNYYDVNKASGTGKITVNIVAIRDGKLEQHSWEVFEK